MWVIFIISAIFCGTAALLVIKLAHKLYLNMKRDEEKFNAEQEVYERLKKNIKEEQ